MKAKDSKVRIDIREKPHRLCRRNVNVLLPLEVAHTLSRVVP